MSIAVPELTRVDEAFPASALSWMPAYDEIPDEFKDGDTEWNRIADSWFYAGLSDDVEFYPREGIDPEKAFRAVKATLGSYAPKHEHKMAAVAFMLSCWFSEISNWRKT